MRDFHTNIMLDLECTDATVPNPIIIEIAAVHFDIDTGAELAHFHSSINFQSSINHGHLSSEEGLKWLGANIPKTLQRSMSTNVSLEQALFHFSNFIRRCCKNTKERLRDEALERKVHDSQPMIWGNGAVADNVWISSAYRSCNMERPWKFYNDMCVRTFVRQCSLMTGRDFAREQVFEGTKHVALDDCRHQVAYLVNARNSLVPLRPSKAPVPSTTSKSRMLSREGSDIISKMLEGQNNSGNMQKEAEFNDMSSTSITTASLTPPKLSHEDSREWIEPAGATTTTAPLSPLKPLREESQESIKPAEALIARPPRKNGLLTPSTSFSNPGEEKDLEEVKLPVTAAFMYNLASSSKRKEIDLPSPETYSENDFEDSGEQTPIKYPMKQFRSSKFVLPVTNFKSPRKQTDPNNPPSTADSAYGQAPSPSGSRSGIWFSR